MEEARQTAGVLPRYPAVPRTTRAAARDPAAANRPAGRQDTASPTAAGTSVFDGSGTA